MTVCVPLILYSHSRVSCVSPSSAGGLLARWAADLGDIQLRLMCSQLSSGDTLFTLREVSAESAPSGHDSQSHTSLLFTADDERQMTVSVMCQSFRYSLGVPPSGRGGKQVEPFCTLIQMAGCNFQSLIVIL